MNPRIEKIFQFDEINFWLVSGNIVHRELDSNWQNDKGEGKFIGGHNFVFNYIPKNEIWINDLDKEKYSTMLHEYIEMLLMRDENLNYAEAHSIALKVESMQRNIEEKIYNI